MPDRLEVSESSNANVVLEKNGTERTDRALIPNQPLLVLECQVQHANDPLDLLVISLNGTRNLLRMPKSKPISLSKIRTLSAHLEEQVLALKVFLWLGSIAYFVLSIVLLRQVLDDSTRFPECEVGIWVLK